MAEAFLTITSLARKTGVSPKALRYWEQLGLLPKASRSQAGYRRFPQETLAYVGFVNRAKAMGLTLKQMRTVLKLARGGRSPCADVERWIERRIQKLDTEIQSLVQLQRSLKQILECRPARIGAGESLNDCCSLIVDLPEGDKFKAAASANCAPH